MAKTKRRLNKKNKCKKSKNSKKLNFQKLINLKGGSNNSNSLTLLDNYFKHNFEILILSQNDATIKTNIEKLFK